MPGLAMMLPPMSSGTQSMTALHSARFFILKIMSIKNGLLKNQLLQNLPDCEFFIYRATDNMCFTRKTLSGTSPDVLHFSGTYYSV